MRNKIINKMDMEVRYQDRYIPNTDPQSSHEFDSRRIGSGENFVAHTWRSTWLLLTFGMGCITDKVKPHFINATEKLLEHDELRVKAAGACKRTIVSCRPETGETAGVNLLYTSFGGERNVYTSNQWCIGEYRHVSVHFLCTHFRCPIWNKSRKILQSKCVKSFS